MFIALGYSDADRCECCGRENLRRSILIAETDSDGTILREPLPFGTTCAARATGRPARALQAEARAADYKRAALAREAREIVASIREAVAAEWGEHGTAEDVAADTAAMIERRAARAERDGATAKAAAIRAAA